jgi:hypothetical protein
MVSISPYIEKNITRDIFFAKQLKSTLSKQEKTVHLHIQQLFENFDEIGFNSRLSPQEQESVLENKFHKLSISLDQTKVRTFIQFADEISNHIDDKKLKKFIAAIRKRCTQTLEIIEQIEKTNSSSQRKSEKVHLVANSISNLGIFKQFRQHITIKEALHNRYDSKQVVLEQLRCYLSELSTINEIAYTELVEEFEKVREEFESIPETIKRKKQDVLETQEALNYLKHFSMPAVSDILSSLRHYAGIDTDSQREEPLPLSPERITPLLKSKITEVNVLLFDCSKDKKNAYKEVLKGLRSLYKLGFKIMNQESGTLNESKRSQFELEYKQQITVLNHSITVGAQMLIENNEEFIKDSQKSISSLQSRHLELQTYFASILL